MKSLAQELDQTCPVSLLERKLGRLGFSSNEDLLSLAVHRGCRHYAPLARPKVNDPGRDVLADEELVVAMISGGRAYEPMLIRCAAQLMGGDAVSASRLVFHAKREKAERVLAHIARAGREHDSAKKHFWSRILDGLDLADARKEPKLPHWSRFVSMPGWQRGKAAKPQWLAARP